MLAKLLIAFILMAACVVLHAWGLMVAVRRLVRPRLASLRPGKRQMQLLIVVAGWTILIHLMEISLWAALYTIRDAIPDLSTALYFSAVTYTTTGYGDVVLPEKWRVVGGIEALTGILMCGWSTGFFFALVSEMFQRQARATESAPGKSDH